VHGYEQDKVHIVYVNDVNCLHFSFNKKCSWRRCKIFCFNIPTQRGV